MNNILSITLDATIVHGTHAKKCVAACTKIYKNEWNLGLHIIKVQENFETLRKKHGVCKLYLDLEYAKPARE